MSLLSVPMTPRRRRALGAVHQPAVPAARTLAARTLADLAVGESARVSSVVAQEEPAAARRLFDLGFAPGAEVLAVRKAPLADPVVFRVAGYDIALRREQACWVSVAAS